jgi:hypothetical protein
MKLSVKLVVPAVALVLAACGGGQEVSPGADVATEWVEPDHVEVQHILVSFAGVIPKEGLTRTQEQAEELANELLKQAREGADFDGLVKAYTDDQHPGIYRMANLNIEPDRRNGEYARGGMVKAFGDVSFSLRVGEIGMTQFDPETSKYGWHIVKRLK